MPIKDYKCNKCGHQLEVIEGSHVSKETSSVPINCLECKEGSYEFVFNLNGCGGFDIVGSCYINDYGKKAWRKNLNRDDQAKVISGEMDPY